MDCDIILLKGSDCTMLTTKEIDEATNTGRAVKKVFIVLEGEYIYEIDKLLYNDKNIYLEAGGIIINEVNK